MSYIKEIIQAICKLKEADEEYRYQQTLAEQLVPELANYVVTFSKGSTRIQPVFST